MTAPERVRRDGRTCDECGGPNFPAGWLDSSWTKYVSDPHSRGEGYSGLVLCALCYADRVERQSGAQEALNVLRAVMRRHQARVASARKRPQGAGEQ